jgi:hypothetical protein
MRRRFTRVGARGRPWVSLQRLLQSFSEIYGTRDPLNPIQAQGVGNHGKMSAFHGLPSVSNDILPDSMPDCAGTNGNHNGNRLLRRRPPACQAAGFRRSDSGSFRDFKAIPHDLSGIADHESEGFSARSGTGSGTSPFSSQRLVTRHLLGMPACRRLRRTARYTPSNSGRSDI